MTNITSGFDAARGFGDSTYQTQQYTPQTYASQQPQPTTQLSQDTFEPSPTVGSVSQYVPVGPTVLSFQPSTGTFGTKLHLRVSTSATGAYFFIAFGSQKCETQIESTAQEGSGTVYTLSCLAPQHLVTGVPSASVPVSVVIEGPGARSCRARRWVTSCTVTRRRAGRTVSRGRGGHRGVARRRARPGHPWD